MVARYFVASIASSSEVRKGWDRFTETLFRVFLSIMQSTLPEPALNLFKEMDKA